MINEEATFNRYGYCSTDLNPDSCLNIIIMCERCGKDCVRVRNVADVDCFCSLECRESRLPKYVKFSHSESNTILPVYGGGKKIYTCEWCGVEYERYKCLEKKHCFCSVACSYAYKSKHMVGENGVNWRGGKVELVCNQCGKKYRVPKCEEERSKYCSKKCYDIWRSINCTGENAARWDGGGTLKVCEVCGGEYYVDASRQDTSKFCSNECRGEWQSINNRGENNPSWNGGTSYGKYCEKFSKKFRETVREKYNRRCYLCHKTEKQNGRMMSVHHTNYQKGCMCDDVECGFVPLCVGCHSKTNHKRFFWQTLFTYALQYEEEYYSEPIPNLLISVDV